jgi:hypothetical protein
MVRVRYKADQYAKIDQRKLITLYDKAELYYQDVELKKNRYCDYEKVRGLYC